MMGGLVTLAPELSEAVTVAVGPTMDPEPAAMAEAMIDELTAAASEAGQTAVVTTMVSVTTTGDVLLPAGQSVTVGGQLVTVRS